MPTLETFLLTVGYAHTWKWLALLWGAKTGCLHQNGELAFRAAVRYQANMRDKSIEELARRLAESLPESLRSIRQDIEENFRAVLKSGLEKLDLVTREEFEVQEAVLQSTREKLEGLAKKLEELEKGS